MAMTTVESTDISEPNGIAFLFGAGADPICYYGDNFTKEFLHMPRLSIRSMILDILNMETNFNEENLYHDYSSFIRKDVSPQFSSFENQVVIRTIKYILEEHRVSEKYSKFDGNIQDSPHLHLLIRIAKFIYSKSEFNSLFRRDKREGDVSLTPLTGEEFAHIKKILLKKDEEGVANGLKVKSVIELIRKADLINYGTMEKDFHTINNPVLYGQKEFYSIIYAYWKAFYSVFLHVECLLDNKLFSGPPGNRKKTFPRHYRTQKLKRDILSIIKKSVEMNNYSVVGYDVENSSLSLKNLKEESKTIRLSSGELYYNFSWVKKATGIITTNYTPCAKWFYNRERISYLNGNLSNFEFPFALEVVNCIEQPDHFCQLRDTGQIYFPFIMATACVKPIIHPVQIAEYSRAVDILRDAHTLVVIGHRLLDDDSHLITLIRDWLVGNKNRRLIFCNFVDDITNPNDYMDDKKLARKFRFSHSSEQLVHTNFSKNDLLEPKLERLL